MQHMELLVHTVKDVFYVRVQRKPHLGVLKDEPARVLKFSKVNVILYQTTTPKNVTQTPCDHNLKVGQAHPPQALSCSEVDHFMRGFFPFQINFLNFKTSMELYKVSTV